MAYPALTDSRGFWWYHSNLFLRWVRPMQINRGILYAFGTYLIWGFLPVYLKALKQVPAMQILGHRIVWSLAFLFLILAWRKDWLPLRQALQARRTVAIYFITGCLLGVNWLTYIWGVNSGFIVETSLGYFINPLVSVLFGLVFLGERLRPWQWLPVGLATAGVLYLTVTYGALPWIALLLAGTFGLYGLVKKVAPLGSLHGLTLETGVLFLPALAYLVWVEAQGAGAFGHASPGLTVLLSLAGVVTAVPLLLFGAAVRQVPLSVMGLMQYLAPTCQFLLGVLVYGEPFTPERLVGFSLVWAALLIFWGENLLARRRVPVALGAN